MPRKAKAKVVSHKKPQHPTGDEGSQLSLEEKKAKLQLFLKDFDECLDKQIAGIEAAALKSCEFIKRTSMLTLLKIPPSIRKKSIREILENGGRLEVETNDASILEKIEEKVKTPRILKTGRKRKKCEDLEPISEEGGENSPALESTAKKSRKGSQKDLMPPPRTSRKRKSKFQTPAQKGWAPSYNDTPLITPKFNPLLPTGTRKVKSREKTFRPLVSSNGSPLKSDELCIVFRNNTLCVVDQNGMPKKIDTKDAEKKKQMKDFQAFFKSFVT